MNSGIAGHSRPADRLSALFDAFEATGDAHMNAPASEAELRRVEAAVGEPIPATLRALLLRLGGGLYEHGHEIFGPLRMMVHDIELVPDMLSVRARLLAEGLGPHLLPFHRADGVVHAMRTDPAGAGEVVSFPAGASYPDLATFLEAVMLRGGTP